MKSEGSPLFQKVIRILAGDMGENSARASVTMFLKRSGIQPADLKLEHLPELSKRLEPGLRVFVGGASARLLAKRICFLADRVDP
jgi:hypothetical protein